MFRLAPVALIAVLALAGCGSPAPEPTEAAPSPTQTVAPTPDPGPAADVVIGAAGVTVTDADGVELASADYDEGVAALVDAVEVGLGEAEVSDEDSCGPMTYYRWGEAMQLSSNQGRDELSNIKVKAATFGGVRIESTPGIAVGDDVSELVSMLPADQILAEMPALIWEVTGSIDSGTEILPVGGVIYYETDGAATGILAPGNFYSGQSC